MTDHTPHENDSESNRPPQEKEVVYRIGTDEKASEAIVQAVAALTNTPVLDLESLYDVVDPEHLDGLLDNQNDSPNKKISVSFRFNGCLVTVNQNTVHIRTDFD